MTPRFKIPLLVLIGVLVIALTFWLRSLASWRPVKLGQLDKKHQIRFLTHDGRVGLLSGDVLFDVKTGESKAWPDPHHIRVRFSQSAPSHIAVIDGKEARGELRIWDIGSGQLQRVFHWPTDVYLTPQVLWSSDGGSVGIVDKGTLFLWNLENGHLLCQVALVEPIVPPNDYPLAYSMSSDGKYIFGCGVRQGKVWSIQSGAKLRSWIMELRTPGDSYTAYPTIGGFFSADGRVMVCSSLITASSIKYSFLDSSTGKLLWKTTRDIAETGMSGDEMFLPAQTKCEVLDIFTGRTSRQLPGPRQSDGKVLRVTHDSIYTLNAKNEILRWRAR